MTVREAKRLLDRLPASVGDLDLSVVCDLCGCETFIGSSHEVADPDPDRPASSPGNVRRVVLKDD